MAEGLLNLIEAPMGGGKTCTTVAIMVDDYYNHLHHIEPRQLRTKLYEVKPYKLDLVRLPNEDNRIIKIPDNFVTHSSTKLLTNFHMFGVKFAYKSVFEVLKMIERDSHNGTEEAGNSKWGVDEGWLAAEARKGMNPLTIAITEYSQLIRKLNIEMFVLTQHGRFLDWRIRYITKRKILTSYDKKTHMVRALIQNLNKGTEKTISYFGPTYWKYYDTNELPPMPVGLLRSAAKYG